MRGALVERLDLWGPRGNGTGHFRVYSPARLTNQLLERCSQIFLGLPKERFDQFLCYKANSSKDISLPEVGRLTESIIKARTHPGKVCRDLLIPLPIVQVHRLCRNLVIASRTHLPTDWIVRYQFLQQKRPFFVTDNGIREAL
ncbi:hypothetical protein NPIL_57441 [Nephila pilipes]|uniref:Uncharacterized protein n=1 Tax=Nephila pilipes TaxID=299642 RepID=A0A8X6NGJ6_NEPPI|nr:hypothetical protein NPIL_57441 [Nephila pilipes]